MMVIAMSFKVGMFAFLSSTLLDVVSPGPLDSLIGRFNGFRKNLKSGGMCVACLPIMTFYKSPLYSKGAMNVVVRTICTLSMLENAKICGQIADEFEDEFDFIHYHGKLSPSEICSVLMSVDCNYGHSDKYDWTVAIPPKLDRALPHKIDDHLPTTMDIIQLTDMHLDLKYVLGSNADCEDLTCCHDGRQEGKSVAGLWGNYGKCSTPLMTVINALQRISKDHPQAKYFLWTGDISPNDLNSHRDQLFKQVRVANQLMSKYIKVPVLPVIGNHDTSPVYSFPPPTLKGNYSISWLYAFLAKEWNRWLPETALKTLRYGGYYSINVQPRLRTIVLNTNYCMRLNPWTLYDSVDPGFQLGWLVSELSDAELKGEKVHIVGHESPDSEQCTRPWVQAFLRILERFQDIILSQFYGHTHKDEFRVYYSKESKPIGFGLIGPSLVSHKGNNPSYRVYHADQTGNVLDFDTYYFNLTDANMTLQPSWLQLYKFSKSYGFSSVTTETMNDLIQKLRSDDDLFQMFYRFSSRRADAAEPICNGRCKTKILDQLVVA